MAYSALAVAKEFLDLGEKDGIPISPMKLIKLVYFAHGWFLGVAEKPLIDEPVQAWKYGPVVNSIYQAFKIYGSSPIDLDEYPHVRALVEVKEQEIPRSGSERMVIDRVWKEFRHTSAFELSAMTHTSGSPWEKAWEMAGGASYFTIANTDIQEYFAG